MLDSIYHMTLKVLRNHIFGVQSSKILPFIRKEVMDIIWALKTCLRRFANNTGADQPAHLCSLISAFVIRVLENTISKLATREISFF